MTIWDEGNKFCFINKNKNGVFNIFKIVVFDFIKEYFLIWNL